MPVRSLNSPVLRWPSLSLIDQAVRRWIQSESARHPELRRAAYFGSYARGDWGLGSDLDLIAIVNESKAPFHRRSLDWDLISLPVAADLLVYTVPEWHQLTAGKSRLALTLQREAVWIFP
jgi:predicted nucleotidyltransferase